MLGDHVNYSGFGTNYLTPLKPLSNRPSALLMQPKAAALRTLGYEKLLPAVHIIYFKISYSFYKCKVMESYICINNCVVHRL